MKLLIFILYFCVFFCNITTFPVFEVVNDYDSHGQKCPLFPQNNVECPLICVVDHSLCPSKLAPTCSPGLLFCGDGTCKQNCAGIQNACQCGDSSNTKFTNYVPCAANQLVDISHFDPANQVKQIQSVCQRDSNITIAPGVWGASNSTSVWLSCPVVEPFFTWKEPMWIAIWVISALEAVILIVWNIYKRIRESVFRKRHQYKNNSFNSKLEDVKSQQTSSSNQDVENLNMRGFKNSILGWIAFISVIITSCLLVVFLGCIVSDYYGALSGVEFGVFLSIELSAKIFITVWHITATWLFVLILYKNKLRNYFRIQSGLHTSTYIQVEYKKDGLVFLDDGNWWVSKLQIFEKHVSHFLGGDILITTCPVLESDTGRHWFEYHCMRYVYQKDKSYFIPCTINLGKTNSVLLDQKRGITTEKAAERSHLLGPNIIKVEIPSVPMAILQEFESLVYLYQIMCEWLWYYFQYYKMGLVQTCIILTSAFIRVFLRLRAEHRIKEMSEHISEVTILRDGKWVSNLCTGDLVPGDVFEIEENTIIPCDAVLLSGTVVVNESALTGEAMPIRKFPISNDETPYEKNGNSKVNTLFAGTIVSQVTPSTDDRVFALVLHTGIASEKGMLIQKILFPAPVSFIFNEHIKVAISILLIWGLVAFCLSLYMMGRGNITSWFYGVFVISEIFSPLLPAAFTINQSVCAARLRTKNILCIDLPRINLSGKVRIFCFDKTGTLTREGLEFYGGVAIAGEKKSFTSCEENPLTLEPILATGIATCHAVTKLKDQFIGNPVDIESFRAMKWDLLPLTGRAFEALIANDKIRSYLLMTRVFARMTPNDKVMCVQLHMEKGVTAMCGDGGNDCGALRAAHVGLALSEAEASIVSPFSTNNRSIMQCVELLRQGRAALATSLANYKYLIFYGQIMGFFELIMFYFSANAAEPVWITIDGLITTTMTFAITQALPAKKLAPSRPTAKPLGAYTLASLLGVVFINFGLCVAGAIIWLFQQDWFICNEFDSSSINKAKWWLLGDNYETMIVALIALFQFTNGAAVVNFGSQFRQSWWRNYLLVLLYICFLTVFSYIILADPNSLGCIYRVNCGTPSVLVDMGYPKPTWNIAAYNSPVGHTVLPKWFRWQLWGYIFTNCACAIIWERICILWIARDWAIKRAKANPIRDRVLFKL